MKKFTVRRFFSVYLRKKSRSKSSSLSRLEVNAVTSSAQVPGSLPRPGGRLGARGPPRAHCHMRCTRRGVGELKLSESWSGFPKIERYYWDLLVIGLVFGPQRGLNSAPTEFLTNFVSRSGQDLGWSPGRCG